MASFVPNMSLGPGFIRDDHDTTSAAVVSEGSALFTTRDARRSCRVRANAEGGNKSDMGGVGYGALGGHPGRPLSYEWC
jgi:hypothetical protein